ncbi:MAG: hypothetical protein F4X54_07390 [Chloroflexi bacterium]|nr:hypothetical protein [Chloroflexota bacterium]
MSVQAYLRWDGMTDEDHAAQDYCHEEDKYSAALLEGTAGFLHDFNGMTPTSLLLPLTVYGKGPDGAPVTTAVLLSRLQTALRELERQEAPELLTARAAGFASFIRRVHELEQAGLNPRVYVSW